MQLPLLQRILLSIHSDCRRGYTLIHIISSPKKKKSGNDLEATFLSFHPAAHLLVDDVRQLLYHFFKVALEALVILELVLFDQALVDVQRHTASLDEMPEHRDGVKGWEEGARLEGRKQSR